MGFYEKLTRFSYRVCWKIGNPFLRKWFQIETKGSKNLENLKGPLIVAFNHSSWLDPFFIGTVVPPNLPIAPIRYAAWYKHYWKFFPFLFLSGAFPIKRGIGLKKTLEAGLKILQHGGTVGIMPEGKRRRFGRRRKGRKGVAFLALKTKAPILPIYIDGALGLKLRDIFTKRKIVVTIGKSFSLPAPPVENLENHPDLIKFSNLVMKKIYDLKHA